MIRYFRTGLAVLLLLCAGTAHGQLFPAMADISDMDDTGKTTGFVITYDATLNGGSGGYKLAAASGGLSNLVEDTSPQLGGELDLNTWHILATNGRGMRSPTTAGQTMVLQGYDTDAFGYTSLVTIQSGTTPFLQLGPTIWPTNDGSAGEFLKTDGSGNLSWDAAGGSSEWTLTSGVVHPNLATTDLAGGGNDSTAPYFFDADSTALLGQRTYTSASGTDSGVAILPTYNQSGTAGSADLVITRTETALGSGNHKFMQFEVSANEKFSVTNTASLFIAEKAAAESDTAGLGQLWIRNDSPNTLMFTDDAGNDHDLTAAGGGSSEWTLASGVVYPNSATTDFAVGGATVGVAALGFDESAVRMQIGAVANNTVLNLGGDRTITFVGGNASLNSPSGGITYTAGSGNHLFQTGDIRVTGDADGSALNVVPKNAAEGAIGVKQFSGGSAKLIRLLDSSFVETMGISLTGFEVSSAATLHRYELQHKKSGANADGDGVGVALKTENSSGSARDTAYIDAIYSDISAHQAYLSFGVKDDTSSISTPSELIRAEGWSGYVGINETDPSAMVHAKAASTTDDIVISEMLASHSGDPFAAQDSGGTKVWQVFASGAFGAIEQSADPANPPEGKYVLWLSDGTGSGDDGDLMVKITAGATTKTVTLIDFSAF